MYSSKAIFAAQPAGGYTYRLSAIDSSGRESHTDVRVSFNGPINSPGYLRTIVRSFIFCLFYVDILLEESILEIFHRKSKGVLIENKPCKCHHKKFLNAFNVLS